MADLSALLPRSTTNQYRPVSAGGHDRVAEKGGRDQYSYVLIDNDANGSYPIDPWDI